MITDHGLMGVEILSLCYGNHALFSSRERLSAHPFHYDEVCWLGQGSLKG